ncbi:MAG: hypothetical protein ACK528_13220 [Alphaproteobacteria bacterium]
MSLRTSDPPVYVPPEGPEKAPFFVQVLPVGFFAWQAAYVVSYTIDDYRLRQLELRDRGTPAGEVYCRLGVPLPPAVSEDCKVIVRRVDGPLSLAALDHEAAYAWLDRLTRGQLIDCLVGCLELLKGSKEPLSEQFVANQMHDVLRRRAEYNKTGVQTVLKDHSEFISGGAYQ